MIIEFLTMKITFDAILDHVNNIAYQQDIRDQITALKTRLLKLSGDFETGRVTREEFEKEEAVIMKEINLLIKQASTAGNQNTTQSSSDLGGLAGLL
ncbi:MAG TPA: hypothetical protein VFA15_07405 [Nitrososphaera sp.]|nr:hypothetical protein [Nitrososphaera sp.]